MKVYWTCVFSVHAKVTREIMRINTTEGKLSLPVITSSDRIPDDRTLLDMCRNLLYRVDVVEGEWIPDPTPHTHYHFRDSLITGEKMLCDRYDEHAFWVAILNENFEVIATQRIITSFLLDDPVDLDVLGYDNCPLAVHQWVHAQKQPVSEISRTAIHEGYRRQKLYVYLCYVMSNYMLNSNYWGTNKVALATFPEDRPHVLFNKLLDATHMPSWSFKYNENDAFKVSVFIFPAQVLRDALHGYIQAKSARSKL
jgi:hypothetical protein